jgi:hypothetical protein
MDVLKQYRKREQEFLARAQDLDAVTMKRDACKKEYDDLRKKRLDEFMQGFNQISSKLKEMYQVRFDLLESYVHHSHPSIFHLFMLDLLHIFHDLSVALTDFLLLYLLDDYFGRQC